jgi:hypothetical protein
MGAGNEKLFVIVIWFVPVGRSDALIHVAASAFVEKVFLSLFFDLTA